MCSSLRKWWKWHLSVWSFDFASNSHSGPKGGILGLQRRMQRPPHATRRSEKCSIYPKLVSPQLTCLGTRPPPLSGIQFDKFCWRNSKEIFPFLSSSGAAGQTVSSTKQFVLNSRISFLVINMKTFCCRNMNSPLTNYGASLLCREIAFWYFTEGCKWIVIMKAFETDWNNNR